MLPGNIKTSNPLNSKEDLKLLVQQILSAVRPYFAEGNSRIYLANTTTQYGREIAAIEAFSRQLWGLIPLIVSGEEFSKYEIYIEAIKNGTNPDHKQYWGKIGDYDQRVVEMAAFGLLLALTSDKLFKYFSETEKTNLYNWLRQSETALISDNNWHYFPVLVQIGFKKAGLPYNQKFIDDKFAKLETYYLGDGWYSDGAGRARDYYISMGFHFYGLLYARMMNDVDPLRAKVLTDRASRFAQDFIYYFSDDGSAIPFGRSQTYRFGQGAFWSAYAFCGLDDIAPGVVKGIILRHLRWWISQPIFDRDGILSIGYSYPNLIMAEDYNAPGSPYWGLKVALVLALPDGDVFWRTPELPLPDLKGIYAVPHANQILVRDSAHNWMLSSGQFDFFNFVNGESKYCKFAYSAKYGFTVERDRWGLIHASPDSMLLLSENDNYWRGRRECEFVKMTESMLCCRWKPWDNVCIDTWLVPVNGWQLRIHQIHNERNLICAEGGFSVRSLGQIKTETDQKSSYVISGDDISLITSLYKDDRRGDTVKLPPNSNILWPETPVVPLLTGTLPPGDHLLCSAVWAGDLNDLDGDTCPVIKIKQGQCIIVKNSNYISHIDIHEEIEGK